MNKMPICSGGRDVRTVFVVISVVILREIDCILNIFFFISNFIIVVYLNMCYPAACENIFRSKLWRGTKQGLT